MDYNYIEYFLNTYLDQIKTEYEVPNIRFEFDNDAFDFFKYLMENHYLTQEYYDYLTSNSEEDCLNIKVHNYELFFNLIISIAMEYHKLLHGGSGLATFFRRIWLRMGINDVENIELFLKRQLEFLHNQTFMIDKPELITTYYDCNVYMKSIVNGIWDESTRSMLFEIKDKKESFLLPHVLYDIDSEGICYIYGVQSDYRRKDNSKHIERKIYKLNDGIDNPNIHPSKVLSLLLFIDQLEIKGITKIIVPSMQVLNYRCHEIFSREAKKCKKTDHTFYKRFFNKQDIISYLKTEELFYLMYRIIEHRPNLEIINEVNLQGDCIIIRNKNIKKR